jgi:hypothetical protein
MRGPVELGKSGALEWIAQVGGEGYRPTPSIDKDKSMPTSLQLCLTIFSLGLMSSLSDSKDIDVSNQVCSGWKENQLFHPQAMYFIIYLLLREVIRMASNKLFDLDASEEEWLSIRVYYPLWS